MHGRFLMWILRTFAAILCFLEARLPANTNDEVSDLLARILPFFGGSSLPTLARWLKQCIADGEAYGFPWEVDEDSPVNPNQKGPRHYQVVDAIIQLAQQAPIGFLVGPEQSQFPGYQELEQSLLLLLKRPMVDPFDPITVLEHARFVETLGAINSEEGLAEAHRLLDNPETDPLLRFTCLEVVSLHLRKMDSATALFQKIHDQRVSVPRSIEVEAYDSALKEQIAFVDQSKLDALVYYDELRDAQRSSTSH